MLGTLIEKLLVSIQADLSGLTEETARAAQDVERQTKKITRSFESVGSTLQTIGKRTAAVGAGATVLVTAPLIAMSKDMVAAWDEQEQALAQVRSALSSTGSVAGRTIDQLTKQATSLQSATLFGDEDILRDVTANLLTFTKVHGKVFDDAQRAVLDYSARLNIDLKSATIQIGKALNDPAGAISALSRAGVQFTDSQKDMIKSLVESGDLISAQNIILSELQTQFGGAAEAAANAGLGPFRQFNMAVGELSELAGGLIMQLLPGLTDGVRMLTGWVSAIGPEQLAWVVSIGAVVAAVGPLLTVLGSLVAIIGTLVKVAPLMLAAGRMIGAAIALAGGPITLTITAIGLLVAAYVMYKDEVDAAVSAAYQAVDMFLGGKLSAIISAATSVIQLFVENFKLQFTLIYQVITGDFAGALDTLNQMWTNVWTTLSEVMHTLFGVSLEDMVAGVLSFVDRIIAAFVDLKDRAIAAVSAMITGVEEWLVGKFNGIVDSITSKIAAVGDAFSWLYDSVVGNSWVPDMVDEIGDWFGLLDSKMVKPAEDAADAVSSEFEVLSGVLSDHLKRFFETGKFSFSSFIKDLSTQLLDGAIDQFTKSLSSLLNSFMQSIFSGIGSAVSGTGGSGGLFSAISSIFSSLFGGRALGGVVPPWKSFIAGERGAELVERDGPSGAARVSTAGRTKMLMGQRGGGGVTVVFNMPTGTNMMEFQRSEGQISSMIARAVSRGQRNL